VATCKLSFAHVTTKTNPADELFAGTHANSSSFVTSFENQVTTTDLAASNLNAIKMTVQNQFNEFESISQAFNVVYADFANASVGASIANKLAQIGSTLTVNDILHRATTQTCAGCHQVSVGQPLGGGLTWPGTLGFVHIDEGSNVSPALTEQFLPHRRTVLEGFINARCGASTPVTSPAGDTLGGSAVGAAN